MSRIAQLHSVPGRLVLDDLRPGDPKSKTRALLHLGSGNVYHMRSQW
jgi:hypothetical protein